MSDYYAVAEYLEGIRIGTSGHADLESARERVARSTRLGIDCEVWCTVSSLTGAVLPFLTTVQNVARVCVADVPRYCDNVADVVKATPGTVYA